MKIAVFGLGNVGLVAALGLCEQGHKVTGIEVSAGKVEWLLNSKVYLHEKGLQELLEKHKNIFFPSVNSQDAKDSECFIVCVGTPSQIDGEVYLGQVRQTFEDIVKVMSASQETVIIFRSTVPPGTVRSLVLPILQASQKPFRLIYHPEFLREGTALKDFLEPNLHVLGYEGGELPCPELFNNASEIKIVTFETAEMLKYVNNSFHALKVSFINEIASLASTFSVDVPSLVDAFLADTKLNLSSKYLRPGYAFGGPCLTKELKAINYFSKDKHVEMPLLSSIISSNEEHIFRTLKNIEKINPARILFFGVSFKQDTDDLRSSPIVDLINLLQRGPSYLKKKEIFIRDNEIVLTMKPELDRHRLVRSCNELPDDIGMVVLGSFRPLEEDRKWLESFKGPVIDLSFYADELNLKTQIIKPYEVT